MTTNIVTKALESDVKVATEQLLNFRDMIGSLDINKPDDLNLLILLQQLIHGYKPVATSLTAEKEAAKVNALGENFGIWKVLMTPIKVKNVDCEQLVLVNSKTGKTFIFNTAGVHSCN